MNLLKPTLTRIFLTAAILSASASYSADQSPVGVWKTIDDHTGRPRGLVRITETNGEYRGCVEKTFPKPGEVPNPKCENCEGTLKNQPVIGMTDSVGIGETRRRVPRR